MLYMVTFTINIPPMLAYIPYMDSMGIYIYIYTLKQQESTLVKSLGTQTAQSVNVTTDVTNGI